MRNLIAAALAVGLAAPGLADVLTFRNGASVSGQWLGIDGAAITFQVNGKAERYAREDVVKVTFGDTVSAPAQGQKIAPPSALPPAAPSAPPAAVTGKADSHPRNVVHFWDPAGPITPMEAEPIVKLAGGGWEIKGARSPYRVQRAPAMLFLVWLANDAEAAHIRLVRLVAGGTSGSTRRPYSLTGGSVPLSLTPAGGSVGLAPVGELAAGEYAFVMPGGAQAYCFGVD